MGKCFLYGNGGGAPLNFKVVGGTSAPSNPKENTIWVSNPNLLDFTTWANDTGVANGTKSVSGNSVTLTANASGDCYTNFGATSSAKIPCTPGKTYIMQWDHSGSDGLVYLFPNADMDGLVSVAATGGKLEYTAGADVTFFTFRIGVQEANTSATYSNIRITEKMDEITGWHFRATQPNEMKQGEVWFLTTGFSAAPFNALKKNCVEVYPVSAKQYIDGELVTKPIKYYQGGEWKDYELIFFENGVFNTSTFGEISGTQKFDSDGSFRLNRNQNVSHSKLVDISAFSRLQFEIVTMDYGYPTVTITNASGATIATFGRYQAIGVIIADISAINEPVKIKIAVGGNYDSNTCSINHFKFLP